MDVGSADTWGRLLNTLQNISKAPACNMQPLRKSRQESRTSKFGCRGLFLASEHNQKALDYYFLSLLHIQPLGIVLQGILHILEKGSSYPAPDPLLIRWVEWAGWSLCCYLNCGEEAPLPGGFVASSQDRRPFFNTFLHIMLYLLLAPCLFFLPYSKWKLVLYNSNPAWANHWLHDFERAT